MTSTPVENVPTAARGRAVSAIAVCPVDAGDRVRRAGRPTVAPVRRWRTRAGRAPFRAVGGPPVAATGGQPLPFPSRPRRASFVAWFADVGRPFRLIRAIRATSSHPRGSRIRRGPGGFVVQEADREADLSAEHPPASQAARLPAPHVDPRRPGGAAVPTAQGPPAAVGLIWRVRDRQTFAELRRSRARVRCESVTLTHVAGDRRDPARVAFAIGRRSGNAVERNRLRRRLRVRLHEARPARARCHRAPISSGCSPVAPPPRRLPSSRQMWPPHWRSLSGRSGPPMPSDQPVPSAPPMTVAARAARAAIRGYQRAFSWRGLALSVRARAARPTPSRRSRSTARRGASGWALAAWRAATPGAATGWDPVPAHPDAHRPRGRPHERVLRPHRRASWPSSTTLWNNYAWAITGLTLLIMLAVTPLTLKGTRSMMVMQQLQPEQKKLQTRYKDDRQKLQRGAAEVLQGEQHQPAGWLSSLVGADARVHRPLRGAPRPDPPHQPPRLQRRLRQRPARQGDAAPGGAPHPGRPVDRPDVRHPLGHPGRLLRPLLPEAQHRRSTRT